MEYIKRWLIRVTCFCALFTAFLPAGLFMTIFGAVNGLWLMLGFGIAFLVVGFYGAPLIWVRFGSVIGYKRIVSAIVVEKIYSLEKIATHLNLPVKTILERVDTCIRQEVLIGYIRNGDEICPNVNINANTIGYKCEACGARFESAINAQPICPYCQTIAK